MKAKDVIELAALMQQAEEVRPVIQMVIEKAKSFGPEIKSALIPVLRGMAEIRVEVFNHYIALGMSRDEALAMTVADIQAAKSVKASSK